MPLLQRMLTVKTTALSSEPKQKPVQVPVVLLLYFFSSELFFVICSKLSWCYSYTEFYERSVQNLWEDIGQFQCKLQRLNFKCTGTSSCYAIVCPNTKKVVLIFV